MNNDRKVLEVFDDIGKNIALLERQEALDEKLDHWGATLKLSQSQWGSWSRESQNVCDNHELLSSTNNYVVTIETD